jgi:hypothetical protein
LEVPGNLWPPRTRFPAPEQAKPLAMPADKGFRLDYGESLSPVEPAPEPD